MRTTPPMRTPGKHGCTGQRRDGSVCDGRAVNGTSLCRMHAGKSLAKHKAEGQVVVELSQWGVTDQLVDSKTAMLRLMSQAFRRAGMYSTALEDFVAEHGGDIHAALVSDTEMPDGAGGVVKVGEYLAGMQRLEAEERDRAFRFSERAVAAGLDERMVKATELQVAVTVAAITAIVRKLGHDPSSPEVLALIRGEMRALDPGAGL